MPPSGRRPRYVPGGIFHPGGTQTNCGERSERCCCLREIACVTSTPESTSRADGSNVGEEIQRRVTSIAAPSRFSLAEFAEQAEPNRRPHIKEEKSPLLRSGQGYFLGGVERTRGQNPSLTKNLYEAPVWHSCLGYFPGGSAHVRGENTNISSKIGRGATLAVRPR